MSTVVVDTFSTPGGAVVVGASVVVAPGTAGAVVVVVAPGASGTVVTGTVPAPGMVAASVVVVVSKPGTAPAATVVVVVEPPAATCSPSSLRVARSSTPASRRRAPTSAAAASQRPAPWARPAATTNEGGGKPLGSQGSPPAGIISVMGGYLRWAWASARLDQLGSDSGTAPSGPAGSTRPSSTRERT